MKFKKILSAVLLLICMVSLGLGICFQSPVSAKAEEPTVEFVRIHTDNNNSIWGGSTRAVRLVFSQNFTAQEYDKNEGGFDSPVIASVRPFVKINGQSLGNVTFVQIPNENSITFLYDESLLAVPAGQEYTEFTIEAGAPFGGHYLPAVTLYFDDGEWSATKPVPDQELVNENVTVTNIHNRNGGDQRLLLFISNSDYEDSNADITAKVANTNLLDYVNVYTSKTEYKTLREIYQGSATARIWNEANSIGFQIDANYHGTAVYAVEIKKGAQFPAATNKYTTYVVSEDVICYNDRYQGDSSANGHAVWWRVVTQKSVTVTNIHNRKGADRRLLLFISNSDYNSNANITAKVANTNLLDYVNVYTSKTEYKTLREIYQGIAQSKIWGEANSIAFSIDDNYHGTAVYAVEIKKGAQFPALTNDNTTYVVSADVVYYNVSYNSTETGYKDTSTTWTTEKPVEPVTENVTVTNIHNRKGADRRLLLFISNSDYGNSTADISAKVANTNLLDCVNVYTSKTEYKTLREIYQGNAQSTIWGEANSIAFSIDEDYHGTAVYAVEIKKGAQFPALTNDNTTYVVSSDVVYYNVSYNSTEAGYKDTSTTWTTEKPVEPEIPVEPVTENVTITTIQNRKGGDRRLLLFISNSDYNSNADISAKVANTNLLDYVNVYTSKTEYKTLREIYQGNAQSAIWGEANSIAFSIDDDYHGTAVYAVEIKKGAQFPALTNDNTTYVVSADFVYYNVSYNSTEAGYKDTSITWARMHIVTLTGELATGDDSAKVFVLPNSTVAYPEEYSKTKEGDENTIYIYNWYLNGNLYDFSTPVTADITLTADGTFTAYYSYNVTFVDGAMQNTVIVGGGQTVAEPEAPTKGETAEYRYVFNGWYNGETKWDFTTPITENVTLTAKYDQIKKLVLSDLYVDGKSSQEIKTGEIKIANSGDHYKGYLGSNVYFDLSFELSYKQVMELATFDVKITNEGYTQSDSPFFLSWHVYYQRPANTLYIEYHKYNIGTGARESFAAAVSEVVLSANEIYQANFAYRVIDETTGLVELYSNIAGWENVLTYELGAEYLATAKNHEYLAFATEGTTSEMNLTLADPGLTGAAHYDVTFFNGETSIMSDNNNQIQLPAIDGVVVEEGLSQVFVGWTTDLETLPDLYPAGYKFKITQATQLYAVWIGLELEDGASVRLNSTADSSGIRFTTNVDSAVYKKLSGYILGTGTFVVPTEYLAKVEFAHSSFDDARYYMDVKTNTWRVQSEDVDVWKYAAALVSFPKSQYARALSARAYLKINFTSGEGYVYTIYDEEVNSRSMYQVATSAYNDDKNDYKSNTQILDYLNSVADIALDKEMGLTKSSTAKGDYMLTSSLSDKTFTVLLNKGVSSAMINGTRIASGATKNVKIGDFIFSISNVEINGETLKFTVGAASKLNDKYSDGNTYFHSSDKDLDFFLNDYFTRHATGISKNGEDQTVNSVVAGKNADEFFWWEWFSTAYYTMDTDAGFDRIAGLREKLSNVPVDDYGYVWQNTDLVRDAKSTLASAEHRMGWPFPTANEMVVIEAIKTSLFGSATNYITKGYSTSWDFNGSDRTAWSSNVNASLDGAGLFKGTANGANKVKFSSPTLPQTHTIKKYGVSSVTVYDEPAIYTYYAPLLELDVRMSNADNVKDIVVYFKTNEGGSTEYSMSVNDYAFIKYDYSGKYEHLLYLPMYAHANWGDSETRYVTNLRIEIIPKDGKTLSGDFALSYVRPSLDTRHTDNNSIFISSLRQDYDYTNDLTFLEQNITRARKAMNFLMQFYDAEKGLMNSSYLVGHDADKTGSDVAQRTAHSLGNGYWDISYMPQYDFHSNSYFYKAVADMAYLESILSQKGSSYASDSAKAEGNVQTAGRMSKSFSTSNYATLDLTATATNTLNAIRATTSNDGFWDSTKGRFVAGYGDADANGTSEWVDYGYVVWNLEAINFGIATDEQAKLIMQWVTGERTVAGDTSTGADIYFFELAPRATTYQGTSETDSSVYTGVWHGTNNGGEYGKSQVQHGGAIMYSSYYDLMNRIAVNGADDAYARLNAIKDWYMSVYAYYQTSGSTPDDFYWDYYEDSQWDSDGDGKGEYWRVQNGIKGQAEREGWTGGVMGIDGEFLESFLPVSAIPYGFFGVESLGNGTLQIAPKLPGDLDFWTAENLTFGGCKYDVTIYENALQISAVRGESADLKLKVAFDVPASDYTVYVNGFATTDYEVVDGQIIVKLAFGNVIVEIR